MCSICVSIRIVKMGKEEMNKCRQLEIQTSIHPETEGCRLPVLGDQSFFFFL